MGFDGLAPPAAKSLPHGQGFNVSALELPDVSGRIWIALSRQPSGSLDLFTTMAEDLASALARSLSNTEFALLNLCLYRIRAWQEFMRCGGPDLLGTEAEVGLFGEIAVLKMLLEVGLDAGVAVDGWFGPEGGLQDFRLGHGTIEVKTTAAATGFPARVGSLEQLDDSGCQSLILAAVRLSPDEAGVALPGLIAIVQSVLAIHPGALNGFECRLIRAGYLHSSAKRYQRRFKVVQTRFFSVDASFPKLTRQAVPAAVTYASYVLDLDRVAAPPIAAIGEVMEQLGAI